MNSSIRAMSGPPPATRYRDRSFTGHAPAPPTPETADPALVLRKLRRKSRHLHPGRSRPGPRSAFLAPRRRTQRASNDQQLARTLEQIAEGLGAIVDALRQRSRQKPPRCLGLASSASCSRKQAAAMAFEIVIESVIGRITDKPRLTVRAESLQPEIAGRWTPSPSSRASVARSASSATAPLPKATADVAAGGGATRDQRRALAGDRRPSTGRSDQSSILPTPAQMRDPARRRSRHTMMLVLPQCPRSLRHGDAPEMTRQMAARVDTKKEDSMTQDLTFRTRA
jgi:hypothetical protein